MTKASKMRNLLTLFTIFYFANFLLPQSGTIGLGTTSPDPSAALDIESSDQGILIPRLSTASRENISNPAMGLMVFDSTTHSFCFYKHSWREISEYGVFENNNVVVRNIGEASNDFVFGASALLINDTDVSAKLFFLRQK